MSNFRFRAGPYCFWAWTSLIFHGAALQQTNQSVLFDFVWFRLSWLRPSFRPVSVFSRRCGPAAEDYYQTSLSRLIES